MKAGGLFLEQVYPHRQITFRAVMVGQKDPETYRVIYGDLSVRDVTPENLPK
jgi:polyisoprenoid-binding protein YceI